MMDHQRLQREDAGEQCSVTPWRQQVPAAAPGGSGLGRGEQYHPQRGLDSVAISPEQEL